MFGTIPNPAGTTRMTTAPVTQESEATGTANNNSSDGARDRKQCFTPIPPHRRVFIGGVTGIGSSDSRGRRPSPHGKTRRADGDQARAASASPDKPGDRRAESRGLEDEKLLRGDGSSAATGGSSTDGVLVSLCPSMDLMVLGSSSQPHAADPPSSSPSNIRQQAAEANLVLHRTMNPQKLSSRSIGAETVEAAGGNATPAGDAPGPRGPPGAVAGCWREDGRVYAAIVPRIGSGGGSASSPSSRLALQLFAVEDMMNDWASAPAGGVVTTSESQARAAQTPRGSPSSRSASSRAPRSSEGCWCEAAEWRWVGAPSPAWRRGSRSASDEEADREEEWVARNVRFPTHFPPSQYHASYEAEGSAGGASPPWPSGGLANLTNRPFGAGGATSKWRAGISNAHPYQDHHLYNPSNLDEGASPTVLPCSTPYSVLALITRTKTTVEAEAQSSPAATATKSRRSRKTRDRTPEAVSPRSSGSSYCLHLTAYLHGRYPWVVDLPLFGIPQLHQGDNDDGMGETEGTMPVIGGSKVLLALSHTLTHAVAATQTGPSSSGVPSTVLNVARLPRSVKRDAALAACAVAIDHHVRKFALAAEELSSSYASSLQPLHAKLEALYSTLQRYSVLPQTAAAHEGSDAHMNKSSAGVSRCLVSYLMGTADPTVVSAIEQYFTSAQFNDQLLTRMDQSLSVALAGVESAAKQLVAASQVIVVQTSELLGLELASITDISSENSYVGNGATDRVSAARALYASAAHLVLDMERVLRSVIETRFVVRDWVRWLRSVAITVKARGTPPTAVLHQQAVQRRAPDDLSERILVRLVASSSGDRKFASSPTKVQGVGSTSESRGKRGRAELVLGLPLGRILETLPAAATRVSGALVEWQKGPREEARASTSVRSLRLVDKRVLSLTTRLGAGGDGADGDGPRSRSGSSGFTDAETNSDRGYFVPSPQSRWCKEWALLVCQDGCSRDASFVDLYAVPLDHSWGGTYKDEESYAPWVAAATVASSTTAAGWMARFHVIGTKSSAPGVGAGGEAIKVLDAVFYGDNGKCSLSSMDGGTGKERRQALALLVEAANGYGSPMLELWLVRYDTCSFVPLPIREGEMKTTTVPVGNDNETSSYAPFVHVVTPLGKDNESDAFEIENNPSLPVIYARTRSIVPANMYSSARLIVSGSRGVGAVVTSHPSVGTAVIDLYDLEDNEEEEEDEAEGGVDEDGGSDDGDMSADY